MMIACVAGPQFYGGPDLQRAGSCPLQIRPPIKLRACHAGYNDDRIGMVMTREDKRARDAGRPSAMQATRICPGKFVPVCARLQ
jgi:hypothetical protein